MRLLQQMLGFIQDYNHHATPLPPGCNGFELIARNGNNFKINLRFLKQKVVTVVLDTDHDVTFTSIDARHAASLAHTTRVSEIENAGKPNERALPPGGGWGFLWKMDTYWRFAERDGGTYVQCETISLTRDILWPGMGSWPFRQQCPAGVAHLHTDAHAGARAGDHQALRAISSSDHLTQINKRGATSTGDRKDRAISPLDDDYGIGSASMVSQPSSKTSSASPESRKDPGDRASDVRRVVDEVNVGC